MNRRAVLSAVFTVLLLVGCARTDPQAALDKTAAELQSALEAKSTDRVVALLHPSFHAKQPADDEQWAKRTMALAFTRYKDIKIIALKQQNTIEANLNDHAQTTAEVTVTGAQGLIPDSASFYRVTLHWRLVDGDWKLYRLNWE